MTAKTGTLGHGISAILNNVSNAFLILSLTLTHHGIRSSATTERAHI